MSDLLSALVLICRDAGEEILRIYGEDDFGVETKADDSPLTRADLAAHRTIVKGLTRLRPEIPVLSEESDALDFAVRKQWSRYFLVDPLDGTKEFINRNGEFTVNIALIDNGVPVTGVVYVPVKNVVYAGSSDGVGEAWVERDGERRDIRTRSLDDSAVTVVASRRHSSPDQEAFMSSLSERFENIETTSMGSSLKLCLVAEGQADIYPRLAPTSEWDTAAAQAVVEAAGGLVTDTTLRPLRYNTKPELLNPHFLVLGDAQYPWSEMISQSEQE